MYVFRTEMSGCFCGEIGRILISRRIRMSFYAEWRWNSAERNPQTDSTLIRYNFICKSWPRELEYNDLEFISYYTSSSLMPLVHYCNYNNERWWDGWLWLYSSLRKYVQRICFRELQTGRKIMSTPAMKHNYWSNRLLLLIYIDQQRDSTETWPAVHGRRQETVNNNNNNSVCLWRTRETVLRCYETLSINYVCLLTKV